VSVAKSEKRSDCAAALAVHDQRVLDLPGVDHHRGQLHPVHEAEARVGQVEVQARRGQAELVVDRDRSGRLEPRTAHRGVDQQADLLRGDACLGQCQPTGLRGRVGEGHTLRPPAARLDPGQLLQHALAHAEPLQGGLQLLVEVVRGDDLGGIDSHHRQDGGIVEPVDGVSTHGVLLDKGEQVSHGSPMAAPRVSGATRPAPIRPAAPQGSRLFPPTAPVPSAGAVRSAVVEEIIGRCAGVPSSTDGDDARSQTEDGGRRVRARPARREVLWLEQASVRRQGAATPHAPSDVSDQATTRVSSRCSP
jgi:hypothetical protein